MKKKVVTFLVSLSLLVVTGCNENRKTETAPLDSKSVSDDANGTLNGPDYLSGLEFKNDYPTNATVDKLYDAIDFQRACQAYIWAMPTVAVNEFYYGLHRDGGYNFGDMNVLEAYATADNIGLTANNNTMEDLKRWLIGCRDCLSMTSRYWFGCPGGD